MSLHLLWLAGGTLLAAGVLDAQTFTTLYTFTNPPNQVFPNSLVLGPHGTIYGATMGGGNGAAVFALTPPASAGQSWDVETVAVLDVSQGIEIDNLALDGSVIYGSAFAGGHTGGACGAMGCGTTFSLAPPARQGGSWTESTLHTFQGTDGQFPVGVLSRDSDDSLFAATEQGGSSTACTSGCGTVVRMTELEGIWSERVLHNFGGGEDGAWPQGPPLSLKGKLYGVTNEGGGASTVNCEFGCGTVYELSTPRQAGDGWSERVIYSFIGGANGRSPSSLIEGPAGVLYGTTQVGGLYSEECPMGCGTVFSLTRSETDQNWTQTVVHRFEGGSGGASPIGLVPGSDGTLYGWTAGGGIAGAACPPSGCGTIFELRPPASAGAGWTVAILHRFSGTDDGWNPSSLIRGSAAGALVGTTAYGGAGSACSYNAGSYGCGTVFELSF